MRNETVQKDWKDEIVELIQHSNKLEDEYQNKINGIKKNIGDLLTELNDSSTDIDSSFQQEEDSLTSNVFSWEISINNIKFNISKIEIEDYEYDKAYLGEVRKGMGLKGAIQYLIVSKLRKAII